MATDHLLTMADSNLTPLALPHYDTRDVSVIADLPYMVVSHDSGQWHIALSQLENALLRVLEPLTF